MYRRAVVGSQSPFMLSRRPPEAFPPRPGETLEMKCVFGGDDDNRMRAMPDWLRRAPHRIKGVVSQIKVRRVAG
jgi:hypothetical protein